jgi:hypothetical protein
LKKKKLQESRKKRIFWDFQEFFGISRNFRNNTGISGMSKNKRISVIFREIEEFSKISWNFYEFSGISGKITEFFAARKSSINPSR